VLEPLQLAEGVLGPLGRIELPDGETGDGVLLRRMVAPFGDRPDTPS
jgi:hypothetical protein